VPPGGGLPGGRGPRRPPAGGGFVAGRARGGEGKGEGGGWGGGGGGGGSDNEQVGKLQTLQVQ